MIPDIPYCDLRNYIIDRDNPDNRIKILPSQHYDPRSQSIMVMEEVKAYHSGRKDIYANESDLINELLGIVLENKTSRIVFLNQSGQIQTATFSADKSHLRAGFRRIDLSLDNKDPIDNFDILTAAERVGEDQWKISDPRFVSKFLKKPTRIGSDRLTNVPLSPHPNANHLLRISTSIGAEYTIPVKAALVDSRDSQNPKLIFACNQQDHPFTNEPLGENPFISIPLKNIKYSFHDEYD